ncbi:nitrate/nitrite transporter [Adlercreutzia sp. ZJ154]|uniref:MFS transporter n=1 Tax=Adlercreutzia sp. ZJ154 TaxID=2709790 RepID=UPI0013EA452D|nr:MFS transporter [Adlercreutzia sp. ZJ154]
MLAQTTEQPSSKGKFHYAFIICLAGFLTQFIVLGCQRLPALSLELIRGTLNISYAEVGLITSWFTVFYAGASFIWGGLADRIGAKKTLTLASAFAAIGTILFGLFAQYGLIIAIIVWCVAGFGCAGLFMATLPKIVAKWFAPEKRGFGMALITPGGNVASILIGLFMATIIANTSWQQSFIYVGIFFAVIAVFIAICVKESPEERGLAPYGAPVGTQAAPKPKVVEAESGAKAEDKPVQHSGQNKYIQVLKMGRTWHFAIMYIIWQLGYMVTVAYYTASIQYVGFSLAEAGLAMTWGGIATIIFIQIWGNMSDHMERKYVLFIANALCAVLSLAYFISLQGQPSLILCYFFVALITACTGITTVILSIGGDLYPAEIRSTGTGVVSTLTIIGRYLGPWIAGIAIDATAGNIGYAYLIVAISMGIAAVIAITLPKMRGTAAANS